jgi:uncharacterized membrane protein
LILFRESSIEAIEAAFSTLIHLVVVVVVVVVMVVMVEEGVIQQKQKQVGSQEASNKKLKKDGQ